MKIRNTIRRKAGSSQTIDGVTYRWNEQNDHVCVVDNPAHAEKLLSLKGWEVEPEGGGETQVSVEQLENEQPAAVEQKAARGRRKRVEPEGGE